MRRVKGGLDAEASPRVPPISTVKPVVLPMLKKVIGEPDMYNNVDRVCTLFVCMCVCGGGYTM